MRTGLAARPLVLRGMCEPLNQWNTGLLLIILQSTWESRQLFEILIPFLLDLHIYRSRTAGSHGSSILIFLRNLILVYIVAIPINTPSKRALFPPVSLPTLFDNKQVWGGISLWFWIFIFLIMTSVGHLFMYSWTFFICSLENCLFKSFFHFQLILFSFEL